MVAGDQDDRHLRQRSAQPAEFAECQENGGVGGSHGVEEVAGDHDGVRPFGDDAVDRPREGDTDIDLALVAPAIGQTMELPEAKMRIGKMSQAHRSVGREGVVVIPRERRDATALLGGCHGDDAFQPAPKKGEDVIRTLLGDGRESVPHFMPRGGHRWPRAPDRRELPRRSS